MPAMRILAIDTSCGAACGVAVFDGAARRRCRAGQRADGARPRRGAGADGRAADGRGRGRLRLARRDRASTVGPGSFTGIRVGLAMARAMGLALDIPVVGVSTLVAFAAPLLDDPRRASSSSAIDARHGASISSCSSRPAGRCSAPRVGALREAVAGDRRGSGADGRRRARGCSRLEARRAGIACEAFAAALSRHRRGRADRPRRRSRDGPPRPLYVKPPDAKPPAGEAIARVEG